MYNNTYTPLNHHTKYVKRIKYRHPKSKALMQKFAIEYNGF